MLDTTMLGQGLSLDYHSVISTFLTELVSYNGHSEEKEQTFLPWESVSTILHLLRSLLSAHHLPPCIR